MEGRIGRRPKDIRDFLKPTKPPKNWPEGALFPTRQKIAKIVRAGEQELIQATAESLRESPPFTTGSPTPPPDKPQY